MQMYMYVEVHVRSEVNAVKGGKRMGSVRQRVEGVST